MPETTPVQSSPERARWYQRLRLTPGRPPFASATPADLEALWRARAVRYVLIYVALCALLLGLRYATQNTYPHLRELRTQIGKLQTQRDTLDLQVQQLTTGPRILDWARAHDMVPYAQASKQSATFEPLSPPAPNSSTPLKVETQWH